jgi:hypothetical protein
MCGKEQSTYMYCRLVMLLHALGRVPDRELYSRPLHVDVSTQQEVSLWVVASR